LQAHKEQSALSLRWLQLEQTRSGAMHDPRLLDSLIAERLSFERLKLDESFVLLLVLQSGTEKVEDVLLATS
jgi:hypothetical protein